MLKKGSQNYIIWEYLKEHKEINDDICRYIGGGKRLAARIHDLRNKEGYTIHKKEVVKMNAHGKEYTDTIYYIEVNDGEI